MTKMRSLTEEEYVNIAESSSVEDQLDLGDTSILRLSQEGQEFFLLSTTSGRYAQLAA